tara:strand:- start:259 stop:837 length:579 start_codon:yes stop_codon:yes gene_type:complete
MEREPVIILDDEGGEHSYNILKITSMKAVKMLSRFQDAGASQDLLESVVDSALHTLNGTEPDADPIAQAINSAAHRIISNGETNLIADLLVHAERDGVKLTKSACELAFQGNLGEMQRALAAVLEESYRGFFVERVDPLRSWGARLVKDLQSNFQKALSNPSLNSGFRGLFTKSGTALKGELDLTRSGTSGL